MACRNPRPETPIILPASLRAPPELYECLQVRHHHLPEHRAAGRQPSRAARGASGGSRDLRRSPPGVCFASFLRLFVCSSISCRCASRLSLVRLFVCFVWFCGSLFALARLSVCRSRWCKRWCRRDPNFSAAAGQGRLEIRGGGRGSTLCTPFAFFS